MMDLIRRSLRFRSLLHHNRTLGGHLPPPNRLPPLNRALPLSTRTGEASFETRGVGVALAPVAALLSLYAFHTASKPSSAAAEAPLEAEGTGETTDPPLNWTEFQDSDDLKEDDENVLEVEYSRKSNTHLLGRGSFGNVQVGRDLRTAELVALKIHNKQAGPAALTCLRNEIHSLRKVASLGNHKNIVALRGCVCIPSAQGGGCGNEDEVGDTGLVFELMNGGELYETLVKNGAFSERNAASIVRQIAEALEFLHDTVRVAHCDVKPENILLRRSELSNDEPLPPDAVGLCDFGSSQPFMEDGSNGFVVDDRKEVMGTVAYSAPELLACQRHRIAFDEEEGGEEGERRRRRRKKDNRETHARHRGVGAASPSPAVATATTTNNNNNKKRRRSRERETGDAVDDAFFVSFDKPSKEPGKVTAAVDIWSLGLITYILLSGRHPFDPDNELTLDSELVPLILRGDFDFDTSIWRNVSASAKDLIRRMLEKNPAKRITAAEVLKHEWVKERGGTAPSEIMPGSDVRLAGFLKTQRRLQAMFFQKMVDGSLKRAQEMAAVSSPTSSADAVGSTGEEGGGLEAFWRAVDPEGKGFVTEKDIRRLEEARAGPNANSTGTAPPPSPPEETSGGKEEGEKVFYGSLVGFLGLGERIVLRPGETVFKMGDVADCFYFIDRGKVNVTIGDKVVARISAGDFVGETGLVRNDTRRNATVVAGPNGAQLIRFTKEHFQSFLASDSPALSAFNKMVEARSIEHVKFIYTTLFHDVPTVHLGLGSVLLRRGEPSDAMYYIQEGEVSVVNAHGHVIARRTEGETVGELGLLTGEPRSMDIVCAGDDGCAFKRLEKKDLEKLLTFSPHVESELRQTMKKRTEEAAEEERRQRLASGAPADAAPTPNGTKVQTPQSSSQSPQASQRAPPTSTTSPKAKEVKGAKVSADPKDYKFDTVAIGVRVIVPSIGRSAKAGDNENTTTNVR